MIFNAENFDIFRLGSVAVSYPPKNINTFALLVNGQNIGALSLEFESELQYDKEGAPFFAINVGRPTEESPGNWMRLLVEEGDWLVILWNEIRVFRQEEFENTFQVDHTDYQAMHGYLLSEDREHADYDAKMTEQLGVASPMPRPVKPEFFEEQDKTEIVPAAGNLYPEGEDPKLEQKVGERIDQQPWMQQAKAELQERDEDLEKRS